MAIDSTLVKTLALEIGVIAVATIATFVIPGLGGVMLSSALTLLGDIGIELYGGGLPTDPIWYLTEILAVFGPYFQEIKAAKMESTLLRTTEKTVTKLDRGLTMIEDAAIESVEYLKKQSDNLFVQKSGLTKNVEKEVQQVEQQELAREHFKDSDIKIKKRINSFTPNTKNPLSWIAGVGFKEKVRLGPRDIRGDLIITYYENNHHRVGFALKPISKIVLGRTSGGERKESNKARYRKVATKVDHSKVRLRKVVFKNARYYGDYLAFLKAHSWGGYYMRRWMVGLPGRKAGTNALILFGNIWRVYSRLKTMTEDFRGAIIEPKQFFTDKSKEFFGQTRLGSKYNQYDGIFQKGKSVYENPLTEAANEFKSKSEIFRDKIKDRRLS